MRSLQRYHEKRDFKRTSEPKGRVRPSERRSFVIQKHAARNLHYDFRLELEGVLLSWAVPKGPSLDPAIKRLAMHVEDHPVEYGGFEGTIPKGEYGGGTVMIWDRGTWEAEGNPREQYEKGRLTFTLHGEKLHGRWHLVRTGMENRWLLFKASDEEANATRSITDELPRSAATGRSMDEIATESDRVWHSKESTTPEIVPIEPELATLVKEPPEGDAWLHEIKLDGYRILAHVRDKRAVLLSRHANDWSDRFSSLAKACARLPVKSAVLDGEVVALGENGVSDFQLLQNFLSDGSESALVYYVFDLLELDGRDLRELPLDERKAELSKLLVRTDHPRIRASEHVIGSGKDFFEHACKMKLEGIMSKRRASPYRSGRGRDWLKVKCIGRQELVIGGWTNPKKSRAHFGALLLGARTDGTLRYVGKVGTGFTEASLEQIQARLKPLERDSPPFVNPPKGAEARRAHWVEPRLVAEIDFSSITKDGMLRHPSFHGLRADKPANEVVLERPAPKLTNPDKLLYPEDKISKREVYEHFERVAAWMLPHVRGRPLVFVRCPDGYEKCFFQKHWKADWPSELRRIVVREGSKEAPYATLDDANGLLAIAQMGVLELHLWGTHDDHADKPDLLVFDLDPDDAVPWKDVIFLAKELKRRLAQSNLESFVQTTGGKGLHVFVPIDPVLDWDDAKEATRMIAEALKKDHPNRYVTTMTKSRRKGKIFIDYFRNHRGSSFIAPYSTRRKPHAPVATPLAWDELSVRIGPQHFHIRNIERRLASLREDPWANLVQKSQRSPPRKEGSHGHRARARRRH